MAANAAPDTLRRPSERGTILKLYETRERIEAKKSDLSGSVFVNVNLSGATFENINASGASIEDANMAGWRVHDVNLSGWRVSKANLAGATIVDSRLEGMTIDGIEVTELLAAYRRSAGPEASGG